MCDGLGGPRKEGRRSVGRRRRVLRIDGLCPLDGGVDHRGLRIDGLQAGVIGGGRFDRSGRDRSEVLRGGGGGGATLGIDRL